MSISSSSSPILKPTFASMFGFNEKQKKEIIEKTKDIFEYSDSFETSNETSNNELLDFELERELECEKELDMSLSKKSLETTRITSFRTAEIEEVKDVEYVEDFEIPYETYLAVAAYLMEQESQLIVNDTTQSQS